MSMNKKLQNLQELDNSIFPETKRFVSNRRMRREKAARLISNKTGGSCVIVENKVRYNREKQFIKLPNGKSRLIVHYISKF